MARRALPIAGFAIIASIASYAAAVGVVSSATGATSGCFVQQCLPDASTYRGGEWIDDYTYETSPIDAVDSPDGGEQWVDYPGMVTLNVKFPPLPDGTCNNKPPLGFQAFAGIAAQPNASGQNFTTAAGALDEINELTQSGFSVTNATCAHYFARFLVTFRDAEADAAASDACGPL